MRATLDSRETGQRSVLYSPMIPRDAMMCLRFYFNVTRIRGRNNFAVMSVINNTPRCVWMFIFLLALLMMYWMDIEFVYCLVSSYFFVFLYQVICNRNEVFETITVNVLNEKSIACDIILYNKLVLYGDNFDF